MTERVRFLSAAEAEHARAVAAGRIPVVPARPAATVLLLRDGAVGMEVYVHHRHAGMGFAAAAVAFPGGGVDPVDLAGDGPLPAWTTALGDEERAVRGFVAAAIRETQEETGVALTPDQLVPWAHWTTPRYGPRRYDTWFFLARLPDGQQPEDVSGEADLVEWAAPADLLRRATGGDLIMLTPTKTVLTELAGYESVAAALDAATGRVVEAIVPGWVDEGDRVRLLLPGEDGYPGDDPGEVRT